MRDRQLRKLLAGVLAGAVLGACAVVPPPQPADPAVAALELRGIAVAPVAYATYQPGEMCSAFIDEELRSALVRELRRRGYESFAVGGSVPRSFAPGERPPLPGDPWSGVPLLPPGAPAILRVWIEEYFENTLCGREGPKYLTMGVVGVLYAGSPPREVWRGRARVAEQGGHMPGDLMWLVTSRVSERLLQPLPVAADGPSRR